MIYITSNENPMSSYDKIPVISIWYVHHELCTLVHMQQQQCIDNGNRLQFRSHKYQSNKHQNRVLDLRLSDMVWKHLD